MKLFLYVLFICSALFANESLFQRGNDEYKNKNYQIALNYYLQVEQSDLESVSLYFNMGNCYYKLGKIGQSIRYYEKARVISPLDVDVKTNLQLVESELVDRIEFPDQFFIFDWYQTLKYWLSLNTWLVLMLLCFSFVLISILIRRFFNIKIGIILGTIFFALFIMTLTFSLTRISDLNFKKAVLIEKNGTVYASPNADTEAFILHEGSKFDIIRTEGNYCEISLIDGKTGWIEQSVIGEI